MGASVVGGQLGRHCRTGSSERLGIGQTCQNLVTAGQAAQKQGDELRIQTPDVTAGQAAQKVDACGEGGDIGVTAGQAAQK